jgi:hypothetical protein
VQPAPRPDRRTAIHPAFKLVLAIVSGFTLIFFLVSLALVVLIPIPSPTQQTFLEWCSTLCKSGFGAIIGLLSGKLTDYLSGED